MRKPKLLPCPFCESEGDKIEPVFDPTQLGIPTHIECSNCMMRGPKADDADQAAGFWNELPRIKKWVELNPTQENDKN